MFFPTITTKVEDEGLIFSCFLYIYIAKTFTDAKKSKYQMNFTDWQEVYIVLLGHILPYPKNGLVQPKTYSPS